MDSTVLKKILFEIEQIDDHINASSILLDLCRIKEPDYVEKNGVAMILHSFYNGIENIVLMILKNYKEKLPNGYNWHIELLEKTSVQCGERNIIFNSELKCQLEEYRKFRHLVRHIYNYKLNWTMMEGIMNNINTIWGKIKENLNKFFEIEEGNNCKKTNVV